MDTSKDNSAQGHIRNSLETMDKSLAQSAKRAGNIVAALYIVSNVLPEGEPLQKEIRKTGLSILSLANDIAGVKGESYDRQTNEINRAIKKVISYLEVGVTMFLISEMNFRILRLELMALGGSYDSRREGLIDIESVLREGREFTSKTPDSSATVTAKDSPRESKGHIKDIKTEPKRHSPVVQKPMIINVLNKPLAPTFGSNTFFNDKPVDDRKSKIIDSLKGKDSSTITDIKTDFPDVSFKTIQRDLQSLIDEGQIERVGERRWSIYRLKNNN
ncbi:MAG: hypothetical protein KBC67_02195 [Candidatus Pacebacteria bacterium]|nr:hypothetical protein [Candidatus Paceibacterota bacterium]